MFGPMVFELIINSIIIPPKYTDYLTLSGSIFLQEDFSRVINNQGFQIPISQEFNKTYLNKTGNFTYNVLQSPPSYPAEIDYFNIKVSQTTNLFAFTDRIVTERKMLDLIFSYTTILCFLNILRIYHFIRTIHSFSYWTTLRTNSVW